LQDTTCAGNDAAHDGVCIKAEHDMGNACNSKLTRSSKLDESSVKRLLVMQCDGVKVAAVLA
jgi:hypothetical protein